MNKRWYVQTVVACAGLAAANLGVCSNAYGVFLLPLSRALGVSYGAVSLHSTIAGLVSGLIGMLVIRLLGKVNIRAIFLAGTILTAGASLCMAYAGSITVLYLLAAVRGVGCACFYLPVVTTVLGNWFDRLRGTITGIAVSFSGLAGAVFSPVFSAVITRYGYRTAYMVLASAVVLLTLPAILLMHLMPEELGGKAYGREDRAEAPKGQAVKESAKSAVEGGGAEKPMPAAAAVCFGILFAMGSIPIGMTSHLPAYAEAVGFGASFGSVMLSTVMIANVSTKFIIGILTDRIGSYRACALAFLCSMAGLSVLVAAPQSRAAMLAAAFCFGAVYSFSSVGTSLLVRSVYSAEEYGKKFSAFSLVSSVAGAIAIVMIGTSYDIFQSYRPVLVFAVGCEILGIALIAAIRKMKEKTGGR